MAKEKILYTTTTDFNGNKENVPIMVSRHLDIDEKSQEEGITFEEAYKLVNRGEEKYSSKIYLDVSYIQRYKVKELGGKWDKEEGKWYITENLDISLFKEWLPEELNSKLEKEPEVNLENTKKIKDFLDDQLESDNYEILDIMEQDFKEEVTLENTKLIMDFLDSQLDTRSPNKDLNRILEEDLTQSSNRREVLLSRGINKIDVKEISFDEKNKQIEALYELSLDELENKYGKKSEELEALTNNSIAKIANTFVKTYKGNTKDELKVSNSFEEFIEKKAPKIIDEQVENCDIFKSYQSKLSKYVRENKNTDSPFMRLLNHYINLPNQILEKQFKDVLKDELKQEMLSKKDVTLQKIQKSFENKSKKKSKGMER